MTIQELAQKNPNALVNLGWPVPYWYASECYGYRVMGTAEQYRAAL